MMKKIKRLPLAIRIDRLATTFHGNREQLVEFFLQLMAWRTLSETNKIPGDLRMPESPEEKPSIFKIYSIFNQLASDFEAFRISESTLEALGGSQLTELLDVVRDPDLETIDVQTAARIVAPPKMRSSYPYLAPIAMPSLMVQLAKIKKSDSVSCLFESSIFLAFHAAEYSPAVSFHTSRKSALPHILNILFDTKVDILVEESPGQIGELSDVVLAIPPFPGFEDLLWTLVKSQFRRGVVLVPSSFLYRTAGDLYYLKQRMIDEKMLDSVIFLPNGVLSYTGTETGILAMGDAGSFEKPMVVDAGKIWSLALGDESVSPIKTIVSMVTKRKAVSQLSKLLTFEECEANEFNISPERYLLGDSEQEIVERLSKLATRELGDIANFYRPQSIREFEAEDCDDYYEISVSDIDGNGYARSKSAKIVSLESSFKLRFPELLLRPFDILLPIKGSVGKVGIVPGGIKERWIANQSMIIIRLNDSESNVNPHTLFHYLSSSIGQLLLNSRKSGNTIPFIQMRDVRSLPVLIPPAKVQDEIENKIENIWEINDEIEERENAIREIKMDIVGLFLQRK